MSLEESTCVVCCCPCPLNINSSKDEESLLISQTICKLFDIQEEFKFLDYCTSCSSLVLNICKLEDEGKLQELEEAKYQLVDVINENTPPDQDQSSESGRNDKEQTTGRRRRRRRRGGRGIGRRHKRGGKVKGSK